MNRYKILAADLCGEFASFESTDWPAFLTGAEAFRQKYAGRGAAFAAFNLEECCCCSDGLTEDERDELGV